MKFETFVIVSLLYQVVLLFLVRRWIKARNNHVENSVGSWSTRDEGYPLILRYSDFRRKVLVVIAACMIVLIQVTFLASGGSLETFSWSSIVFGIGLNLGLAWVPWAVVAEAYGIFVLFDDEKITRISPWSRELTVRWSDVMSVTYWSFWNWFSIKTDKGVIHVNTVLENLNGLTAIMVQSVPTARIRISDEILAKALNGPFRF